MSDSDILSRTTKLISNDLVGSISVRVVGKSTAEFSSSVTVHASTTTTAKDCRSTIAKSLDIIESDSLFFSLVFVLSIVSEDNVFHFLHTCSDDEYILETYARIFGDYMNAQRDKIVKDQLSPSWYYKDDRGRPFDFEGDVSGDSSSDEEELSVSDLRYLAQAERRGYLLKRSRKDRHLWRRRLCVLTDKLWYVKVQSDGGMLRAGSVPLNHASASAECFSPANYPFGLQLQSLSVSHYFRALSTEEHRDWLADIRTRASEVTSNNAIAMVDMVMCDGEFALSGRMQHALTGLIPDNKSGDGKVVIDAKVSRLIFAFALAVQRFRELFRHDLSISSEDQWLQAVAVFDLFLQPILACHAARPPGPPSLEQSSSKAARASGSRPSSPATVSDSRTPEPLATLLPLSLGSVIAVQGQLFTTVSRPRGEDCSVSPALGQGVVRNATLKDAPQSVLASRNVAGSSAPSLLRSASSGNSSGNKYFGTLFSNWSLSSSSTQGKLPPNANSCTDLTAAAESQACAEGYETDAEATTAAAVPKSGVLRGQNSQLDYEIENCSNRPPVSVFDSLTLELRHKLHQLQPPS